MTVWVSKLGSAVRYYCSIYCRSDLPASVLCSLIMPIMIILFWYTDETYKYAAIMLLSIMSNYQAVLVCTQIRPTNMLLLCSSIKPLTIIMLYQYNKCAAIMLIYKPITIIMLYQYTTFNAGTSTKNIASGSGENKHNKNMQNLEEQQERTDSKFISLCTCLISDTTLFPA